MWEFVALLDDVKRVWLNDWIYSAYIFKGAFQSELFNQKSITFSFWITFIFSSIIMVIYLFDCLNCICCAVHRYHQIQFNSIQFDFTKKKCIGYKILFKFWVKKTESIDTSEKASHTSLGQLGEETKNQAIKPCNLFDFGFQDHFIHPSIRSFSFVVFGSCHIFTQRGDKIRLFVTMCVLECIWSIFTLCCSMTKKFEAFVFEKFFWTYTNNDHVI